MTLFQDFKAYVKLKTGSAPARTRSNAVSNAVGLDRQPADRIEAVTPPSNLPPLAGLPTLTELGRHVEAYRKARYYHVTALANVESIMSTGLDPKYGGSDNGASHHSGTEANKAWSKDKVHVGRINKALGYEKELSSKKPVRLRVFLTPEQEAGLGIDRDDPDFNNDAFWTNRHLMPNQLVRQNFSRSTIAELQSIFGIVREYYPQESRPDVNTIIHWHFRAMKLGLLNEKVVARGTHKTGDYRTSF